MKDYGNAIRTLRKRSNITQNALAEKLNISGQAVSKWENNSSQPDFETIVKMTEIFGITINEFAELCSSDDFDSKKEIESSDDVNASKKQEKQTNEDPERLIGVCSECGSSIYNEDHLWQRIPKLLCKSCKERQVNAAKREEERKQVEIRNHYFNVKSQFIKATVIPAIVIGILAIVFTVILLTSGEPDVFESILGCLGLLLLVYIMVVQICWNRDGVIGDIFFWSITKTFSMPGVIFSLDLEGLIWLIVVKLGLSLLSIILSVIVAVLGIALCLLLSPFVLPFSLVSNIRRVKRGEAA